MKKFKFGQHINIRNHLSCKKPDRDSSRIQLSVQDISKLAIALNKGINAAFGLKFNYQMTRPES